MLPLLILPFALALGVAAHGGATPAAAAVADTTVADPNAPVTVRFENQSMDLATLYAVPSGGMAVRLGQVFSGGRSQFVVPKSMVWGVSTVDFVAVPFARNFVTRSGPVTLSPGDAYDLSLSPTENSLSVLPKR